MLMVTTCSHAGGGQEFNHVVGIGCLSLLLSTLSHGSSCLGSLPGSHCSVAHHGLVLLISFWRGQQLWVSCLPQGCSIPSTELRHDAVIRHDGGQPQEIHFLAYPGGSSPYMHLHSAILYRLSWPTLLHDSLPSIFGQWCSHECLAMNSKLSMKQISALATLHCNCVQWPYCMVGFGICVDSTYNQSSVAAAWA